ncbi:MAG: transposase [bacterium]|nr:transposase [bacterium]
MKEARENKERCVLLFQDEGTFYRQPSQACLWAPLGRRQPYMRYSHRSNTRMRVIGYLNAVAGAVHAEDMSSVTVKRLARSVSGLPDLYPDADTIYLVWDNWPNHIHPTVQDALARHPRLKVVPLPTYASWLNPAEKLWRWTRQRVSHAHPWCDDFREFRGQVMAELNALSEGSEDLLQYVGLST